jgi:hypothetical protein
VLVRGWRVVPERRRQGQRVALVVEAIRRLSWGCCAVAVFPGMGEYPEDCEQVTEAYRLQAKEEITALWESIGFQLFRRGVWLLDTALRRPGNSCRPAALNCARSARPYSSPGPSESGSADTTADADGTGSCRGGRVRSGFSCGRWSGSGKP